jgi:sulfhydrogenase subunit delta
MLNEHYQEWKKKIEFVSASILQKKEEIKDIDVAFIEGAVTSNKQEEKVKKIRKESKKVVAIGSCACVGMPSSQRNLFDEKTKKEINKILIRFQYAEKVKKLSDVITVDEMVPGCPMDENNFLRILNKYLKEFGII